MRCIPLRGRSLLFVTGALVLGLFALQAPFGYADTQSELIDKRKAELEKQLADLETLIERQQSLLSDKRTERVSLERDLEIIDAEIEKARIAIRAQEATIADLEVDIVDKQATILQLTERIDMERTSLARLLQHTAELDQVTLVEMVLSERNFSDFFTEVDDFEAVKTALQESFLTLESLRGSHESARLALERQKEEEGELKELRLLQEERLRAQEGEKEHILRVTKGEEQSYQELIAANERSAAQIRSELFELRGSAAIPLGDAIEYANFASAKTGVRPAFVLGVLKQETRLGEFLGNGSWKVDMHPTRDRPLFPAITSALGVSPDSVPVSAAPSYGWGGAMGPAQFIPSTWACYGGYVHSVYKTCNNRTNLSRDEFYAGPWEYDKNADRLRQLRGKQSPSNPWDNQDAFLASAVYMMDLGAAAGTTAAEREAALRYFAGGNWQNPAYSFYADGVLEHAAYFQKQIDTLKRLSESIGQ